MVMNCHANIVINANTVYGIFRRISKSFFYEGNASTVGLLHAEVG
jgi:hypothetical protein